MEEKLIDRRGFVIGSLAAAGAGSAAVAVAPNVMPADAVDVRKFGASPSATAFENSRAFAAASAVINRRGSGTLFIPPGQYLVGHQEPAGRRGRGFAFQGADIITIRGCSGPVTISGKGARLKAAPGLRYGSFNPITGRAHSPKMPFYDRDFRAETGRMILVEGCSGPVRIEGVELDGSVASLVTGGQWGDTGLQLAAIGIMLNGNTGPVTVQDVHSHHHGQDGIMVGHAGLRSNSPRYQVTLLDSVFDSNARQGLSWVGGTALTAERCRFSRTGRVGFSSAPAAGVDVEAENSVCRNGRFIDCEFSDNVGVGFLADSGDSANLILERCKFVGTTSWSAWPKKPGIAFNNCLFVGAIVNVFGSSNPVLATKFNNCRFRADPKLSPTGKIYGSTLADLGSGAANVVMNGCQFDALVAEVALPWTGGDVRYNNCRFRQVGKLESFPRGVFTGRNEIVSNGRVELYGSKNLGQLLINGKQM